MVSHEGIPQEYTRFCDWEVSWSRSETLVNVVAFNATVSASAKATQLRWCRAWDQSLGLRGRASDVGSGFVGRNWGLL